MPPAAQGDDVVADVFEVANGRRDDPGLGESGKEADTEGGMEGGNRGGNKGGEDGEGMAESDCRTDGGEGAGGENPGEGRIHEPGLVAEKESGNEDGDNRSGDQPGGGTGGEGRLGDEVESADVVQCVAVKVAQNSRHMGGTDEATTLFPTAQRILWAM